MYINVTKKALKMFRNYPRVEKAEGAKAQALANPLYSWHVSYFTERRRRMLYFLNDASELFLIIPNVMAADYSKIQQLFERQLTRQLKEMSISQQQIDRYLKQAGPWQINRTVDRHKVGILTRNINDINGINSGLSQQMAVSLIRQFASFDPEKIVSHFEKLPAWQKPQQPKQRTAFDRLRLRNTLQQIQYIAAHRDEIADGPSDNIDRQIQKLQGLNNVVIGDFIAANRDRLGAKTLKRHQQRLTFYFNEFLAYRLLTLLHDAALDLEEPLYHGFSMNEMRQTRTAMKKLYQFLYEQDLIEKKDWLNTKEFLNSQLQGGNPNLDW